MRSSWNRRHGARLAVLPLAGVVTSLCTVTQVSAEERKFAVMLAHSPKAFVTAGQPGLPPDGLPRVDDIRKQYFDRIDPTIDSFVEYWEEISYGDVVVTGQVMGWVTVPWAFEPDAPSAPARPSPANFINLRRSVMRSEGPTVIVQEPVAYGAGEDFCDNTTSFDSNNIDIDAGACGALIIRDLVGDRPQTPPSQRGRGMNDEDAVGISVWTPGERFADIDGDNRWDAIDERFDQMCHGSNGCRNACARSVCEGTNTVCHTASDCAAGVSCVIGRVCSGDRSVPCDSPTDCVGFGGECVVGGTDTFCATDSDCPVQGEVCGDPPLSGPRGCAVPGCGDRFMPCIDYDLDGTCTNCAPCFAPVPIPCESDRECPSIDNTPFGAAACIIEAGRQSGFCKPTTCVLPLNQCNVSLPPCCEGTPEDPPDCENGSLGLTCGDVTTFCCEFDASGDGDDIADVPEPFEDYMIRYNPSGANPAEAWVRVDEDYVRNNYPGDVEKLVRRTGNRYYDSPDLFLDNGSTKMMQDAGAARFAWRVPKPGARAGLGSPTSGFYSEAAWFDQWWSDRYASTPPAWPGGTGPAPPFNSPRMRPFDPENPAPPILGGTEGRRWFKADRGGWDGNGHGGSADDPLTPYDRGGDSFAAQILPEEVFGYYDGWVEHDDLPSSKYHKGGDKRLGEITSPSTDTVSLPGAGTATIEYTAVFGVDIGKHDPGSPTPTPDQYNVAAGPYAVRIHGEKGYDAGDVCIVEWLTWRTDGTSPTVAYQWEEDNDEYHPYAGPSTPRAGGPIGFRDYNLDGMIDQGETRPELSENYSVDMDPFTENDGTHTEYPFNRRRLLEDVVEALDPSIDWDDYIDVNALDAVDCIGGTIDLPQTSNPAHPGDPTQNQGITPQGLVSGIVIVPGGSYADRDLFPRAPGFYPIHNNDNNDANFSYPLSSVGPPKIAAPHHRNFNLNFHDLVICAGCRDNAPAETPYAAHEYGHSWEGFPDLYDYDFFGGGVDEENCPVGRWDIMAGGSAGGGLVHPIPPLKAQTCTDWIEPIDLARVVTPGVETTLTLPPVEFVRDSSYFYLTNDERPSERYYFWAVGLGFDERMPGAGMLILHADEGANDEGQPLQQRTEPYRYVIVQADGRGDLEACTTTGNGGDDGDVWPGSSNATVFNFDSDPPARWYAENSWTGLDISNVVRDEASGSVEVTLTWTPTNIPGLQFIDPPGGESVNNSYPVRFNATDVYGGTTIQLYYMKDERRCTVSGSICSDDTDCAGDGSASICVYDVDVATATAIGSSFSKTTPGTSAFSEDWNLLNVADGRYVIFAKLTPGSGADGVEVSFTKPRKGRNSVGTGTLTFGTCQGTTVACNRDADCGTGFCQLRPGAVNIAGNKARSETWTAEMISAGTWRINSTLTQPEIVGADPYPRARTGVVYTSEDEAVKFLISEGNVPFAVGDTFTFSTTGLTAPSQGVTVLNHEVSAAPRAAITASPLSGPPPLIVTFDGRGSRDPNGEELTYRWDFGDGDFGFGSVVQHTFNDAGLFTVTLRVENSRNFLFDETSVDINVSNNAPQARVTASPTSGPAPLDVHFDGSRSSDIETPVSELIYQWDFGDGGSANDAGVPGILTEINRFYTTNAAGQPCTGTNPCRFSATLTVTDGGGKRNVAAVSILVGNTNPVANIAVSPSRGPAPLEVSFDTTGTRDAEGHTLTIDWDWDGDGVVDADDLVNRPLVDVFTHTYVFPGTYTPKATIRDGFQGRTTWVGTSIQVTENRPPIAALAVTPRSGVADVTEFTFDASGSIDPDSDLGDLTFIWDFDDNTAPGSGVMVTHTYATANTDGFNVTLTVTDRSGASDQASTVVVVEPNPGNQDPVAHISTLPPSCTLPCQLTLDAGLSYDVDDVFADLEFRWTISTGGQAVDTLIGSPVTREFAVAGTYEVELRVLDGRGGVGYDGPVTIVVGAPAEVPTDPPDGGGGGDGEPTIPDSALQRPTGGSFCGLGMVMSLFGSLVGLWATAVVRRRWS